MFITFQSALRGLTAPSGSCYVLNLAEFGKIQSKVDLFLPLAGYREISAEPRRILCLSKHDWQYQNLHRSTMST